ncbi:MAG: PAAR domain-containing protein [Burkholderiales bacterium]|nr:PAAR domain-containing protein [Burkholderiales bacterium]
MASRPFIVLGDQTDHGGVVIEASVMTDTHGKGIARVGDQVTCPKRNHGTTVIVTGDPTMIIDGKAAARHGDKCACGAILISSQFVSTVGDGGTSNPQAASAAQAAGAAHLATHHDDDEEVLEQYFELVDGHGNPAKNFKYDLIADGQVHTRGASFSGGKTAVVTGDKDVSIVVWAAIDGGARYGR